MVEKTKEAQTPVDYWKTHGEIEKIPPWRIFKRLGRQIESRFFEENTEEVTTEKGVTHQIVGVAHKTDRVDYLLGLLYPRREIDLHAVPIYPGVTPERLVFESAGITEPIYDSMRHAKHPLKIPTKPSSSDDKLVDHREALSRAGISYLVMDVVFLSSERKRNPPISVKTDFRNLLLAEKLAGMGNSCLCVSGLGHVKRDADMEAETLYEENPEFHTVVEYLEKPESREERWRQYADNPELLRDVAITINLDKSMDMIEMRAGKQDGEGVITPRFIRSPIRDLDYVKPLLAKVAEHQRNR